MRTMPERVPGRIAVVGPCASGKSELVSRLQTLGYEARHCAQEHSYVPDMWRRISRPEILIYLDASPAVLAARRATAADEHYLRLQRQRLAHARSHCDLYIDTSALDKEGVLRLAVRALTEAGVAPRQQPPENDPSGREPPDHLT